MGAKTSSLKRELVGKLAEKIESYPVVGIVDIEDLPATHFQHTRQKLRGEAEIIVSKNTLLKLSIELVAKRRDPRLGELVNHLGGQTALILTRLNPFKLNKILRESKVNAPARPGSRSPTSIVIRAGETDFAPGPVVGELQRVGIKARIQAGRVTILEDSLLLKEGDIVSKEVADVLTKLGIMPLELGMKLRAVYEGGVVFSGEVLDFDQAKAIEQIKLAWRSALNLAFSSRYPTSLTVGPMIADASSAARNLALNLCLPIPEVIPTLLAAGHANMLKLASIAHSRDEKVLDEKLRAMIAAAPSQEIKEKKVEEEPEKPKEEKGEEFEGLSKLFG